MNFKYILACMMAIVFALGTKAENVSKATSAHRQSHQELLANQKNRINMDHLSDYMKNDILGREDKAEHALSAESRGMLADLLKEGSRHLGKKYRHGAKGPAMFDCSGFTSYIYRQFGYSISPSSRTQYTQGTSVSRKELREGDLVFFTSRSSGKNVGHVGMVVSADNEAGTFRFIHASIKGVRYSDSTEPYYKARYVGARRIITE